MSMPATVDIIQCMQDFKNIKYSTSDQHKEATHARIQKDFTDIIEMLSYLMDRNPFGNDTTLHSIATGTIANADVNADQALQIGLDIQKGMIDKYVFQHSFKKKEQIITMEKHSVKIGEDNVVIDPQVLFQRIITVKDQYSTPELFSYELCSYPPSLFEGNGLPLEATKSQLADAIWGLSKEKQTPVPAGTEYHYVLDGGALLHRVPWPTGATCSSICQTYVDYVTWHYGCMCVSIVFDGYGSSSTKDAAHKRRNAKHSCPCINFQEDMVCSVKREDFLSNASNKVQLIKLVCNHFEANGMKVTICPADADLPIVTETLASAKDHPTILVGDDSDLLVLLCYYSCKNKDVYFKSEPRKSKKSKKKPGKESVRVWNVKQTKESLGKTTFFSSIRC